MDLVENFDTRLDDIIDCLYRVASKAIIIREHKILLVKEAAGWYGAPGGGVDHGQNARESLIRELEEEIGVVVSLNSISEDPLFVSVGGASRNIPRVTLFYNLSVSGSFAPQNIELSFKWVNKESLSDIKLGPNTEIVRSKIENLL